MGRTSYSGPRTKKNTKRKSHTGLIMFMFVIVFTSIVGISYAYQTTKYNELLEIEKKLTEQIEEEKQKNFEYKNQQEYYKSDAYIEKIAREQLGLIKPDELVIVNRSGE